MYSREDELYREHIHGRAAHDAEKGVAPPQVKSRHRRYAHELRQAYGYDTRLASRSAYTMSMAITAGKHTPEVDYYGRRSRLPPKR